MFISTALVRSVVVELEGRGLGTDALLRASSLDRAALGQPGRGLRNHEFNRLMRLAYSLSGDPALGLAVGSHASKTELNVLGMLILTSPTARDAYRQLTRYADLIASDLDWQLSERGALACLGHVVSDDSLLPDARRFLAECTIALALRFGRAFAPHGAAHEVWFQHAEPSYAADYEATFRRPVRFQQTSNAVLFARDTLDRIQPYAEPMLHAMLCELAEKQRAEVNGEDTFAGRVRRALRYETDLARVDSESLAQRWGLSRRALRRRLANEGASFSALIDEARYRRAVDELKRPGSKIKDVAEDLGYSETSAFHRAFKRWTGGRTPMACKTRPTERPRIGTE